MYLIKYTKFLVFTVSTLFIFFNSHLAATVWHIETVDSSGDVGGYQTSLALDSSGNPHICYYDATNWDLKYAYFDGSWHIETVDSDGNVGKLPSLALDSSGNPHICYYDQTNNALKYAYNDGSWHIETVDSDDWLGMRTSLALDSSGNPHISYHIHACPIGTCVLKYAYNDGSWHTETVDSDGGLSGVGSNNSLALDSSGNPHISYYNVNDGLKYAYYDGSWHTETVVDAEIGSHTSLTLDSSGNPHISYYDRNDGLKYAYNDGSWHIETVVSYSYGDYGVDNSLALDSSGNPHISYFDETQDDEYPYYPHYDLKYAYNDGSWHIETVDSDDWVGEYNSLALDRSGNPHISYFDFSNDNLKYASISAITTTTTIDSTTTTTTTIDSTTTTTIISSCPSETIYGEHSEQTELLRYFRDAVLNQTPEGQELIKLYYQWSPVIVQAMEADKEFKEHLKEMVDGVLKLVEGKGGNGK